MFRKTEKIVNLFFKVCCYNKNQARNFHGEITRAQAQWRLNDEEIGFQDFGER